MFSYFSMTINKEHAFYLHTCLQWMKWAIIPVSLFLEVTTWTKWNWQQLVYTTNHTYVTASVLKLSCLKLHVDTHNLKGYQWSWRYCALLKWMQLPCTAWVQSLNTLDDNQGKTHIYPVKNMSLFHCMTSFPLSSHLLDVLIITSLSQIYAQL
jgi:hypothetical protein